MKARRKHIKEFKESQADVENRKRELEAKSYGKEAQHEVRSIYFTSYFHFLV
jgi:hypothetical protein